MIKLQLHWQILIAIALAVVVAMLIDVQSAVGGRLLAIFDVTGQLFMNALKMIIVPLIVSSLIVGIAAAGGARGLGRLAGKTVSYYLLTSLLAILVGLFFVNLLTPGIVDGVSVKQLLGDAIASDSQDVAAVQTKLAGRDASSLVDVLLSLFPPNIIAAATDNGQLLGLIVFSLLYGFFLTRISEAYAEAQYNFWHGMLEIMMKIIELIMRVAPIGVFALIAHVLLTIPPEQWSKILHALGMFTLSVLLGLAVHVLVTLPLLMSLIGRVNPWRHYQAMAPALLTAFSTASSSATLPLTMKCVQNRAGVSERTSSFVLPLGATVNMDGTALYECVAAMFIAQAYGLELSFTTQFIIVLVALLTSIGVAGIPAASLVAISIILSVIGLPLEGIALLLAVDRLLDMCRTSVNVFSDSCGAVIIAKSEGEQEVLSSPVR